VRLPGCLLFCVFCIAIHVPRSNLCSLLPIALALLLFINLNFAVPLSLFISFFFCCSSVPDICSSYVLFFVCLFVCLVLPPSLLPFLSVFFVFILFFVLLVLSCAITSYSVIASRVFLVSVKSTTGDRTSMTRKSGGKKQSPF
jgi:glucan phosphoethanolaminetransferase (alkaline phosphatase superfamily)